MERIKHLFEVEGVSFVLLVNRAQIENYIRAVYGSEVDARSYLLKFGTLFVDLPNQPNTANGKGREDYAVEMSQYFGILEKVGDGDMLVRCIQTLVPHFDLTLRELERVCSTLALYYASLPPNYFTNIFLVVLLAILKVKDPVVFAGVRGKKLTVEEFYRSIKLEALAKTATKVNPHWFTGLFDFCLMSEEELKALTNSEEEDLKRWSSWLAPYNIGRQNVVPFLCRRLERFSLQPQKA